MMDFQRYRWRFSINQLLLASAAFITVFHNLSFFRALQAAFADGPSGYAHILSLAAVLFCSLLLFLSLFSARRIVKPMLAFFFLLSAATAYFMDSFSVVIDREMIVNAFATDSSETADLLSARMAVYLLLLGLLPALLLSRVELREQGLRAALFSRLRLQGLAVMAILALAWASSAFYATFVREYKMIRYYSNPLTPVYSLYSYGKEQFRADSGKPIRKIAEDARIPLSDTERELIVLVVGETVRADHFSLNGYERETTPLLAERNVISFHQVTACGTSTAVSVPCMFSVYGHDEFRRGKADSTENVLDVLQRAGVHVLWRDNNSNSKGVSRRVETQDFRSPEVNPKCDVECRDEGMLEGLAEYIDGQDGGDILVVLHQMGSHGPAYYKRYPEEFSVFEPTCRNNQLDSCAPDTIRNSYDNSIRYTDYFLSRVIDLLQRYDDRFQVAMFYAGDHGESLGESGLYLHGMPYALAPEAQIHVPMVFWFGDHYDDADVNAIARLADTPLTHDHLFHTLLSAFEIQTGVYNGSLDILGRSRNMGGTLGH